MREISVNEIENIKIGQVENVEAATGCTVFLAEEGMRASVDVRGGGPASCETQLLNPLMAADKIHAITLGGGSAFGLTASGGVRKCLEERGIGFDVGVTKVPLVVQSDIFDLTVGDTFTRPDVAMGYAAAKQALEAPNYKDGNFGVGCGATVGKIAGMDYCTKTGIGSMAVQIGELQVGAVVVLNALGDVYDWKTGQQIAGLLSEDKTGFRSTLDYMKQSISVVDNKFVDSRNSNDNKAETELRDDKAEPKFSGNTTLAVVMTNAYFEKSQLAKIAGMAHDGYARSINPVHSTADGDSIYAVSLGEVRADQDLVGALAAEMVSEAIIRAVDSAENAYGFPSRKSIIG